jgi:lipoprotein-anchoring transpeptidase ErfK/SrfK
MRPWFAIPMAIIVLVAASARADSTSREGPVASREVGTQPQKPDTPMGGAPGNQDALVRPTVSPIVVLQVLLDRAGFSPGEIDGVEGENLANALTAFEHERNLPERQEVTPAVLDALGAADVGAEVLLDYTITDADVAGPFTTDIPEDLTDQASLPALGYSSVLEMLGERFHVSPKLLQRLNPGASFANAGETVRVPNVPAPPARSQQPAASNGSAVTVIVSENGKTLRLTDQSGRTMFQAPVTVGSEHDPLPIGEWAVRGLWPNPVFHYNPELFWDADPSHSTAAIQPGPNNPVGVMWIDLTRDHYGLHGTPEPSRVGHTFSHGCVRLTNWDIMRVAALVAKGTRVVFEE